MGRPYNQPERRQPRSRDREHDVGSRTANADARCKCTRSTMRFSTIGFCLLAASAAFAADAVSVKPTEVNETRAKQLVKSEGWNNSRLEITVHVEGESVNVATAYGKMKF